MSLFDASLVFESPSWPLLLQVAAGALVGWEVLSLLRRACRARAATAGLAIGIASLAVGPLLALIFGIRRLLAGPAEKASAKVSPGRLGARGTLVMLLAGLTFLDFPWPLLRQPAGQLLAIGACAVVWALEAYRRTTSPLKTWAKRVLLGLRVAVALMLVVMVLRPVLEYRRTVPVRGVVLIGIDVSGSMQRRDMPADYTQAPGDEAGATRIDAVQAALEDNRSRLMDMAETMDIEFFTFSDAASPAGGSGPGARRTSAGPPIFMPSSGGRTFALPPAVGKATALGDSVADAFTPYAASSRDVAAILVISDGCNNTSDVVDPVKEAELMGSRGVSVFAVGAGSDTITRSTKMLSVKELRSADEVEAFNRLPITASIETIGLAGQEIRVSCRFGDQEVGVETFTPAEAQKVQTVTFVHVPLLTGHHRLTVQAECVKPVTALEGQGADSKLVHVMDRQLRVLYIEGRFRYESKYITQALAAAPRFSVDRRLILDPAGGGQSGALSENPDDWIRYHAIILGDVPASAFTKKQLDIIKDLVSVKGKGLCMLGGSESFGLGRWADTPVADVLPVDLKASNQQIEQDIRVVPTDEGLRSDIMKIAQKNGDNKAAWAELGALPGANHLGKAKLGASVLATDEAGDPMIVSQNFGAGRSLAIAFDTTWRWVLNPKDTAESQRIFWRQVAMFLAAPKGNIWIATDKTSYDLSRLARGAETIEVSAGVEDASGASQLEPAKDVTLLASSGKESTVRLERKDNIAKGRLQGLAEPGLYSLKISATVDGKPLAAEHQFEVVQRDLEATEVLANLKLLEEVATAGRGKYAPLRDIKQVLDDLAKIAQPQMKPTLEHDDLTGRARWPLIAIIIAMMCAEWAIRKRKGLV